MIRERLRKLVVDAAGWVLRVELERALKPPPTPVADPPGLWRCPECQSTDARFDGAVHVPCGKKIWSGFKNYVAPDARAFGDKKLEDELRVSNFGGGGWTPLSVEDLQRHRDQAGDTLALDPRWQATFYARALRSIRDEQPGANSAVKALAAKALEVGE